MVSPFETVVLRLKDIGAFQFLFPFMLTAAVFYGLLRKTKLFGPPEKNISVNAVVALVAAFMVWASPVLLGIDVETQLAAFFFQGTVAILVVVIALLIAGTFLPEDLPKYIGEKIKTGWGVGVIVIAGLLIGGAILFSSGLISLFIPGGITVGVPGEELISIVIIISIMIGTVVVIMFVGGKK